MVYAIPLGVPGVNSSAPILIAPPETLAADTFNRANNDALGTTTTGGYQWTKSPTDLAGFQIESNTLYTPSTTSTQARSAVIGPFPADVTAEVTFVGGGTEANTPIGCHLVVRRDVGSWYGVRIRGGGAPNMNYHIIRGDGGGSFTSLLDTGISRNPGDRVRITAKGSTISVQINGSAPQSVTDTTYSGGGEVGLINLPTAGGVLAEFRLDDLAVSTPIPA